MSLAAIVLAAGQGSRFGATPKMLARLGGTPLVRHVVEAALASRLGPVLVVTGHEAGSVSGELAGLAVTFVPNMAYSDGLSTSLRAGFAALPAGAEGAAILLGDMPLVRAGLLDALAGAWLAAGRPAALVPTFGGRRGNPVILGRALAREVANLTGDAGAGPLLRGRPDVVELEVDDASVTVDIDTAEALARLAAPSG